MTTNKDRLIAMFLSRYTEACNDIADIAGKMVLDSRPIRPIDWVGGYVGGTADFGGSDFLDMQDMVAILQYKATPQQYEEWQDYASDNQYKPGTIRLGKWLAGARPKNWKENNKQ